MQCQLTGEYMLLPLLNMVHSLLYRYYNMYICAKHIEHMKMMLATSDFHCKVAAIGTVAITIKGNLHGYI